MCSSFPSDGDGRREQGFSTIYVSAGSTLFWAFRGLDIGVKYRVLDPHFVRTERYATLVVAEIPENKLLDTVTEIFRYRTRVIFEVLPLVFEAICARMTDEQLKDYLHIVSHEMMTVSDTNEIASMLQMLTPPLWPKLGEMSRLRIETIMMNSIRRGEASPDGAVIGPGGYIGTWARDYARYFTQRLKLNQLLVQILRGDSIPRKRYVFTYFGKTLPYILEDEPESDSYMLEVITSALCDNPSKDSTGEFLRLMERLASQYPDNWVKRISEAAAAANLPFDPIPF